MNPSFLAALMAGPLHEHDRLPRRVGVPDGRLPPVGSEAALTAD